MDIKNMPSVFAAIERKIGAKTCPLCGKLAGYTVERTEFQALGFERSSRGVNVNGSHGYIPCVTVICKNCGCVQQLALSVLLDKPNYITDSL